MIVIFVFLRSKLISRIVKATTYFRMTGRSVNCVLENMWEEIVIAEYEDFPGTIRKITKHSNRTACFRAKI
jgi:hypothetical protein